MPDTIAARVARGAALLDEKQPGWVERIDLGALWMRDTCGCVLGQLYEDPADPMRDDGYWLGLRALEIPARPVSAPERFGFAVEDPQDYGALDAAWRTLVESRRTGTP